MFSQHSRLFSQLGQLVPANVKLFEVLQPSQAFKSYQMVVANVQKLKVGLRLRHHT